MSTIPSGSLITALMAHPVYVSQPPPLEEVQAAGLLLLEDFVEYQFENANLPPDAAEMIHGHDIVAQGGEGVPAAPNGAAPNGVAPEMVYASLPEGYADPKMKFIGNQMKDFSKKFDTSHERFLIKLLANNVALDRINADGFTELLTELFSHGITEGCIVALFFFCSDVLIRCVRSGIKDTGKTLFIWMRRFLISRVCTWVFSKGGWERVLAGVSSTLKVLAIAAVGLLAILGAATYLKSK